MPRLPYLRPQPISDNKKTDREILLEIRDTLQQLERGNGHDYNSSHNCQSIVVLPVDAPLPKGARRIGPVRREAGGSHSHTVLLREHKPQSPDNTQ